MSLIFEALQKLDRRRAGLDLHPKLEMADLSQRAERMTAPRWETDPDESTGEVPLSEYAEVARFSDLVDEEPLLAGPSVAVPSIAVPSLAEPSHPGPALVAEVPASPVLVNQTSADNLPVSPAPTSRPFASPTPASFVPAAPAPAVHTPAAPGPELASRAPASSAPAGLTVSEAPFQIPPPPARAVAAGRPPQPTAPVQAPATAQALASASAPARPKPAVDLAPIAERLAGLRTQQRELREMGIERNASLARLGDHLDDVRHSSDRNTREQSELFKELRSVGRRINILAVAGLVLTAASVALSCALYLRFLNVIH